MISGSTFRLASDEAIASLIYAARDEAVAAMEAAQAAELGAETARDIAAGHSADAAVAKSQAELAALAAGAPLYSAVPGDFTGIPSPFLLSTSAGVQVYTHDGSAATLIGWLGEVKYPSVDALLASVAVLGPVGQIITAKSYLYEVVSSGEHLITAGGVRLRVVPVKGVVWAEAFADIVTATVFQAAANAAVNMALALREYQDSRLEFRCASKVETDTTLEISNSGAAFYGLNVNLDKMLLSGMSGGTLSATAPLLTISLQNAEIAPPYIDGGRNGSCLELKNCTSSRIRNPRTRRPAAAGYGIKCTGNMSNAVLYDPTAWEFTGADPEFSDFANFSADGLVLDAEDFVVEGGMPAWSRRPIVFTANASLVRVYGAHPFNGSPGGTEGNRIIVESESPYGNMMFDCYFDNGAVIDHGGNLIIQGGYHLKLSSWTLDYPWVRIKCTAAKNGQSPSISNIQGLRTSVGYLPDDTNTYNWSGNYSGLDYASMHTQGWQVDAIKTRYRIGTTTSNSETTPHEYHYKPGGTFVYQYKIGSSEMSFTLDPVNGKAIISNNDPDGLPIGLQFGEIDAGIWSTGGNRISIRANATYTWHFQSTAVGGGALTPVTDNTTNIGTGSLRVATIYAATGTINTSDQRAKTDISALSDAEKRVAVALRRMIKSYRFSEAVAAKGDDARIHIGVIAQEVKEAFEIEGLDGFRYGILCHDEWDSQGAIVDRDGAVLVPAIEAGDRYSIRYDELSLFLLAAL